MKQRRTDRSRGLLRVSLHGAGWMVLAVLALSNQAQAFNVILSTVTHEDITEEALAVYRYTPAGGIPIRFLNLQLIKTENRRTDENQSSERHCDNNQIAGCQGRVKALKNAILSTCRQIPLDERKTHSRNFAERYTRFRTSTLIRHGPRTTGIREEFLDLRFQEGGICLRGRIARKVTSSRRGSSRRATTRSGVTKILRRPRSSSSKACACTGNKSVIPILFMGPLFWLKGIAKDRSDNGSSREIQLRAKKMAVLATRAFLDDLRDSIAGDKRDAAMCALMGDTTTPGCVDEERCGNGVVDESEECDDGNNQAGDGCSAECRDESAACTTLTGCWIAQPPYVGQMMTIVHLGGCYGFADFE